MCVYVDNVGFQCNRFCWGLGGPWFAVAHSTTARVVPRNQRQPQAPSQELWAADSGKGSPQIRRTNPCMRPACRGQVNTAREGQLASGPLCMRLLLTRCAKPCVPRCLNPLPSQHVFERSSEDQYFGEWVRHIHSRVMWGSRFLTLGVERVVCVLRWQGDAPAVPAGQICTRVL